VREYWDLDAATYDHSPGHDPQTPVELAVWAATLRRLLPPPPARVLDAGAGTGFLSLLLAREGYRVTALDLAPAMLAQLNAKAQRRRLSIEIVEGNASEPSGVGYDAVVERHLVWTLPDPRAALEAWRQVAPTGTLVLLESSWGGARRRFGAAACSCPGPSPATQERGVGTSRGVRRRPPFRAPVRVGHGPGAAGSARRVGGLGPGSGRAASRRGVGDPGGVGVCGRPLVGCDASFRRERRLTGSVNVRRSR
jgi:SAM-dependent methyltransferase